MATKTKADVTGTALVVQDRLPQLAPMSLSDLGTVLARSGFFADARQANQAMVKVLAGKELGVGPITSMTGINIIKGKVSLSANLIAGCIKRSGRYNYRVAEQTAEKCSLEFTENGQVCGKSEFTIDDAKHAEIYGAMWKKYPQNMLFARAISNGAKWFCPDVFGGPVYTPDELGCSVSETGEAIDVTCVAEVPEGQAKAEAAVKQLQDVAIQAERRLAEQQAEGRRLAAAAEPDHAQTERVHDKTDAEKVIVGNRVGRFKHLVMASGVAANRLKQAIVMRGHERFTQLKEADQDEILAWLDDVAACQALVTSLGLNDAKIKEIATRAGVGTIADLTGPLAADLRAVLQKALNARNGVDDKGREIPH